VKQYRLVLAVFLLVCLQVLFSVTKLSWELAVSGREGLGIVIAFGVTALAAFFAWRGREPILVKLERLGDRLSRIPRGRWLAAVLIAGLLLRLGWALAFPAPQTSDAGTYFQLGAMLARGEPYVTPLSGTRAEWPPGLPLLLAAAFKLVGIGRAAVILLNMVLFAGLLLATDALARRLAGEGPARFATLLLALWPNLIATAGLANKEAGVSLALTLSWLCHLDGQDALTPSRRWLAWSGAGLALGYATLSQPATLLVPAAFVAADLFGRVPLRRSVPAWGLLAAGMALVIAPWMVRNEQVLGRRVLGTNGGSVFYRANNPLAIGGWSPRGERSLAGLGELEASDVGFRWGKEWIRENPGDFFELALRKQILFLGDDASGVYESLKRGLGMGGALYAGLKLLATAWWWGLWLLILLGIVDRPDRLRTPEAVSRGLLLLIFVFLYFWAIDSVFESGSRHHMPLAGAVAVLASLPLGRRLLERQHHHAPMPADDLHLSAVDQPGQPRPPGEPGGYGVDHPVLGEHKAGRLPHRP
jgi:4-amino-4-deoxy-L-arabinose transferase-like glycosyltransferase